MKSLVTPLLGILLGKSVARLSQYFERLSRTNERACTFNCVSLNLIKYLHLKGIQLKVDITTLEKQHSIEMQIIIISYDYFFCSIKLLPS